MSGLQGALDLALGLVEFGFGGERAGGAELGAARRVLGQFEQRVDRSGTLRSPLTCVVAVPPTSELPSLERFSTKSPTLRLATASWQAVAPADWPWAPPLLLGPFDRRLGEAEGGRVDFVLGALVVDEGVVGEQRQAAVEVDVLAVERAARLRAEVELGQLVLALALERAREAEVEVAAFVPFGIDLERKVRLPLLMPFRVASLTTVWGFSLLLLLPLLPQAARATASASTVANRTKMRSRLKAVCPPGLLDRFANLDRRG